ncbi:MAG: response regulator transcription factor [Deltaproteobacteria bacterium]|nr:response regulator transcription factor [Deltaproteobacteria bacterium]
MRNKSDRAKNKLRILVADDSPGAIDQISSWIEELCEAEIHTALTPEDAIRKAIDEEIENLVLDIDFGSGRDSGVAIARKILESRSGNKAKTRILFRTVHAGDAGYLRQIERFITDSTHKPEVWGFVDKGAVPKRLVQNAVEQVFIYEISFTDIFNQHLKNSPSREFSDLEFTVLIYLCLGLTNDGIGWLLGASRQSVERIISGLYEKIGVPGRREARQGVASFLEKRTRLSFEAIARGLVNPHLLREEDDRLTQRVKKDTPSEDRLYINPDWLHRET